MSMSSRLTDAFARIGQEFKAVRSAIAQKYTKPIDGIPLEDLAAGVQDKFNPYWVDIRSKPAEFQPSQHNHDISELNATGVPGTGNYLRGDGTWNVPPNTTYPVMTQAAAQTGTGTTLNTISPTVLKGAINYHTSGKVNAASGSLTIWTGAVADLPTTKDANTLYFAW